MANDSTHVYGALLVKVLWAKEMLVELVFPEEDAPLPGARMERRQVTDMRSNLSTPSEVHRQVKLTNRRVW